MTGFKTWVLAATLDTGALHVYEFKRQGLMALKPRTLQEHDTQQEPVLVRVSHRHLIHEGPRRRDGISVGSLNKETPEAEQPPQPEGQTLFVFKGLGNRDGTKHKQLLYTHT